MTLATAHARGRGCGRPVLHSGRRCANIRHRFGGHLRAARTLGPASPSVMHRRSLTADALGGSVAGHRVTGHTCRERSSAPGAVGDSDRDRSGTGGRSVDLEEDCMKLAKIGALAAVSVLVVRGVPAVAAPAVRGAERQRRGGRRTSRQLCKDKKGTSSNEIHVYSSLPRQGYEHGADEHARRADQADARRPEDRRLHDQVLRPRRLVGRQQRRLGRRGRAAERQQGGR